MCFISHQNKGDNMKTRMSGFQLGNTVMGDQHVSNGSFEKVKVLGTLHADHSKYEKLEVLGEAALQECEVKELLINGELTAHQGAFQNVKVNGTLYMEGTSCYDLSVLGEVRGTDITCHILRYGSNQFGFKVIGTATKLPQIQGETLENFMYIALDGKQKFRTIINSNRMKCGHELMCERFYNFHSISLQELNADFCYIDPSHSVNIKELYGTLIIIDQAFDEQWLKEVSIDEQPSYFIRRHGSHKAEIGIIEADEVVVDDAVVNVIRARSVVVGPHACVECIEYSEACKIHETAKVKQYKKVEA